MIPYKIIYFIKQKIFFYKPIHLFYPPVPLDVIKCRVYMHLWATDFWGLTFGRRTPTDIFSGLSLTGVMSNHKVPGFSPKGVPIPT